VEDSAALIVTEFDIPLSGNRTGFGNPLEFRCFVLAFDSVRVSNTLHAGSLLYDTPIPNFSLPLWRCCVLGSKFLLAPGYCQGCPHTAAYRMYSASNVYVTLLTGWEIFLGQRVHIRQGVNRRTSGC